MTARWVSVPTLASVVLGVALVVSVQVSAPGLVRVPLGLTVALAVPGVLGYRAVRGRLPRTLSDLAIGLAASIGTLALTGVVLNLLPTGLNSASWSIALLTLSVVLGVVGDFRQKTSPPADAVRPRRAKGGRWAPQRGQLLRMAPVLVGLVLLGAGAGLTLTSQQAELDRQPLTEMWLTGDDQGQTVHVRNAEGTVMDYRMVTSIVGGTPSTTTIRIAAGEEWSTTLKAPTGAKSAAPPFPVSVSLYRGSEQSPYRTVRTTMAPG